MTHTHSSVQILPLERLYIFNQNFNQQTNNKCHKYALFGYIFIICSEIRLYIILKMWWILKDFLSGAAQSNTVCIGIGKNYVG